MKTILETLRLILREMTQDDIPCTIDNQIKLFLAAGYLSADKVWHRGKTAIIVGQKAI